MNLDLKKKKKKSKIQKKNYNAVVYFDFRCILTRLDRPVESMRFFLQKGFTVFCIFFFFFVVVVFLFFLSVPLQDYLLVLTLVIAFSFYDHCSSLSENARAEALNFCVFTGCHSAFAIPLLFVPLFLSLLFFCE